MSGAVFLEVTVCRSPACSGRVHSRPALLRLGDAAFVDVDQAGRAVSLVVGMGALLLCVCTGLGLIHVPSLVKAPLKT